MFIVARFANLGDLDKVSQLSNSRWRFTICKSCLLASADIWHFKIFTLHSDLNLAPPKSCARGLKSPLASPSYATERDRLIVMACALIWSPRVFFNSNALACVWNCRSLALVFIISPKVFAYNYTFQLRTWCKIDFWEKCFVSRFSWFSLVVLRNLNVDKCSQNACRVIKAQQGRRIPYFIIVGQVNLWRKRSISEKF